MNDGEYVFMLNESALSQDQTWKTIWDENVAIIVTLLTSVAKVSECKGNFNEGVNNDEACIDALHFFFLFLQDDLSTLSDVKSFGDINVCLQNEDILPDFTIRTMKVNEHSE